MSHKRKKLGRRSAKDRRWTDWDIYRSEAERLGIDKSDFFTASDVATIMASNNEKIKYGQRKRGDLYINGATIARYQWQGGHTDEQIAAIINAKAAEGIDITVEDVVREHTWEELDDAASALNEDLKHGTNFSGLNPEGRVMADSHDRARIISQQVYHSSD